MFIFFLLYTSCQTSKLPNNGTLFLNTEPLNRNTILIIKKLLTMNPEILSVSFSICLPSILPAPMNGLSSLSELLEDPIGLEFDNFLFLF